MEKVKIVEISKMKSGINNFAKIVFNNFKHISRIPELQHNMIEISRLLSSSNTISYVIYSSNVIIGYLIGEKKHLNDGRIVFYISYLYICKKYRGKNLGSHLVNLIIDKCKSWGIKFILLTCDTKDSKVIKFYDKFGFRPDTLLRSGNDYDVYTLYL